MYVVFAHLVYDGGKVKDEFASYSENQSRFANDTYEVKAHEVDLNEVGSFCYIADTDIGNIIAKHTHEEKKVVVQIDVSSDALGREIEHERKVTNEFVKMHGELSIERARCMVLNKAFRGMREEIATLLNRVDGGDKKDETREDIVVEFRMILSAIDKELRKLEECRVTVSEDEYKFVEGLLKGERPTCKTVREVVAEMRYMVEHRTTGATDADVRADFTRFADALDGMDDSAWFCKDELAKMRERIKKERAELWEIYGTDGKVYGDWSAHEVLKLIDRIETGVDEDTKKKEGVEA